MRGFSILSVFPQRIAIATMVLIVLLVEWHFVGSECQAQDAASQLRENSAWGSRSSVSFPQNDFVLQSIEIIRNTFATNDTSAAWNLIDRVLAESNVLIPSDQMREISSHEEIRRLLSKMPADQRRRFDEQRLVSARAEWGRARVGTDQDVLKFIDQFGETSLGIDAWWWIGSLWLDQGQVSAAESAFRRGAEHPKATAKQRALMLAASLEILTERAQFREAITLESNSSKDKAFSSGNPRNEKIVQSIWTRFASVDRGITLNMRGRSITLGEWLDQHRPLPNSHQITDAEKQNGTPADSARRMLPALFPIWNQQFSFTLKEQLELLEKRQREQGARPVAITRPLVVGSSLIVRTLEKIESRSLATGEVSWTIPNREFQQVDKLLLSNPSAAPVYVEWAQRRTEADSIFGSLSTDGNRLFVVEEPNRQGEFRNDRDATNRTPRSGPQFNSLCCFSLETGLPKWSSGGTFNNEPGSIDGYFFLGAPLVQDDEVYVIAQQGFDLFLIAIEAESGHSRWKLSLGRVSPSIQDDLQRSRVACPILAHNGRLICATGAGMVVSVDPALRMIEWGYRYPAITITVDDLARTQNQSEASTRREPWWTPWRTPFAAVGQIKSGTISDQMSRSILVMASPETDELHAVTLPTGEPLWRVRRDFGVFVAGIEQDLVVVIEGDFARAHDLRTGQLAWRTPVGEIGGPATISHSVLFLPLRDGSTVALDVRTGSLLLESAASDEPLGTLTESESGWIALNHESVKLLPRLEELRSQTITELAKTPDSEPLRIRAAALDLESGNPLSARSRLEGLQSSDARDVLRRALVAILSKGPRPLSAVDRIELANQLTELASTPEQKFVVAEAISSSAMADGDLKLAVSASLDGLTADLDQFEILVKRSSVQVRKDRILLGLIDEAFRRSSPTERGSLDDIFLMRIKEAKKRRDRKSLISLARQWSGLEWSRRLVATEDDHIGRRQTQVASELQLLDAAGATDTAIGKQALEHLASRYERMGLLEDARGIKQRIQREFSIPNSVNGNTARFSPADEAQKVDSLVGRSKSSWPESKPTIEKRDERNWQIYSPIIPIQAEPGSLSERIDVCVNRTGEDVVFRGESFFQSGEDEEHELRFPLTKTQSLYRGSSGYLLRQGWGIGRNVLLHVGSELFAISPLDDEGEPNSKFLWSNPVELHLPFMEPKLIPGRHGQQDEQHVMVDESNRPLVRFGPVRSGYFCYQKGSRLVAIETETGRELWQRVDNFDDATILGDDQQIYIWRESKLLEILSAVDGRKVGNGVWIASPGRMIHQHGSLVWTLSQEDRCQVELHDLRSGQLRWSQTYPPRSLVKVLDPEHLAIVAPEGLLHILQARTGQPCCQPLTVDATDIIEVVSWFDHERWYLALTRPVKDLGLLKAIPLPFQGYRMKFLNGPLYAVDRNEPRVLWSREFKNEGISLDQSRAAPVLIQLWIPLPEKPNEGNQSLVRLIDKRTGDVLFEERSGDILPYFLLNPDPRQSILELKLSRMTVRLTYEIESVTDPK